MLRWLGFKKVSAMPYDAYIDKARGQKSLVEQAGPHRPQPLSRAQARRAASARLWTSELITAQQLDRLVAKKTAPILLDVREEKWSGPLPRPLSELKSYRLHWKEAIEPDGRLSQSLVKKQVVQDLKAELALRKGPAAQVVVVSFAGLSSALVTMALREVSIDAVNLSEGLSWYL
jgi:3-mercaptopyruvate sulfurtransferase SseA